MDSHEVSIGSFEIQAINKGTKASRKFATAKTVKLSQENCEPVNICSLRCPSHHNKVATRTTIAKI